MKSVNNKAAWAAAGAVCGQLCASFLCPGDKRPHVCHRSLGAIDYHCSVCALFCLDVIYFSLFPPHTVSRSIRRTSLSQLLSVFKALIIGCWNWRRSVRFCFTQTVALKALFGWLSSVIPSWRTVGQLHVVWVKTTKQCSHESWQKTAINNRAKAEMTWP